MVASHSKHLTPEEYIALDDSLEERWEYVDGEAFAMAGGSTAHGLVARNLVIELTRALQGKPCVPFGQGQRIATVKTRAFHYPDGSIVCPPFTRDAAHGGFTTPVALFEVLSPSTADYDRGAKFERHYRSIETLREYVLVNPEERRVEYRRIIDPARFTSLLVTTGDVVLEDVGIRFPLAQLWQDLDRVGADAETS